MDQQTFYSKINDVASVFAVLVIVSTAAGNETTIIPMKDITKSITTEASVGVSVTGVAINVSMSDVVARTTAASGDPRAGPGSGPGSGPGHGHAHQELVRSTVVHSTISYMSGDLLSHNSDPRFVVPHFHLSDSRWGPFFEEGPEPHNVTARIGSTVTLDCRIGLLHDRTVTWSHHKNDSIHLLTVGRNAYSSDERITLSFRYPNNWRLEIVYVTRQDQGMYECQVATHPPKVKRLYLKVIAPELTVVDELGRKVTERYYKAGSILELTCIASQTESNSNFVNVEEHEERMSWRHEDRLLKDGISYNFSVSTNTVISTLTIAPVNKKHSGNYTCAIDGLTSSSVSVHILNDELPAAVYHGNSASQRNEERQYFITIPFLLLLVDIVR